MQLTVEAVTKAPRLFNGATIWGVKAPDGTWYSLHQHDKPNKGDTLNVNVEQHHGKDGRAYLDAYPIIDRSRGVTIPDGTPAPAKPQAAQSNGHIPWEDYRRMAEHAHMLAARLEPDGTETSQSDNNFQATLIDRSAARAAILNTVMIAFSNGKIALPKQPDEPEGWQEPF